MRHQRVQFLTFALSWLAVLGNELSAAEIFEAADRVQLFVDRSGIAEVDEVTLIQHPGQEHPGNSLIVVDRPWARIM